jgi:hypothetical protein
MIPADAVAAGRLAPKYSNASLGEITVRRVGKAVKFDFGEFTTEVASRKNDDGTIAFVTIGSGFDGIALVVGEADGQRTLKFRDAQQDYVFTEQSQRPSQIQPLSWNCNGTGVVGVGCCPGAFPSPPRCRIVRYRGWRRNGKIWSYGIIVWILYLASVIPQA